MKTRLIYWSFVMAVIFGAHLAPAQPTNVGITSASGQILLFWPVSLTNGVLQTTTNVSGTWVPVTNAVPVTAVMVPNTSPAQFFRYFQSAPIKSTTADGMALVPAGPFTMGDMLDGEPDAVVVTNVNISGFYMDTNLVSYTQWQLVYNWAATNGYGFDDTGSGKVANEPVYYLEWYDVVKWANARSQQAGLTPVYYTDAGFTQVYTNGDTDAVYANWAASGYRLPTEAEWEKAARGGLGGQRFPWGLTISESQANYHASTGSYNYDLGPNGFNASFDSGGFPYTSPVGAFPPNGYGLFDMAGNMFEWCWDWYGTPYAGGSDPRGPASGGARVLRGGAWNQDASNARCANRYANPPGNDNYNFSFRCVRGL